MTRKKRDFSREVLPDPKFGDILIASTVNVIMRHGKKSVAEQALYDALDTLSTKTKRDPVEAFHEAIGNIRPAVEVRSRRVGGATYQVPTEVNSRRATSLALRWLKIASTERSERTLSQRLANELMDALQRRGGAVRRREDSHRMADANKAFSHLRF